MVSFHLTSAILFGEILYAKVQRASGRQVSLSLTGEVADTVGAGDSFTAAFIASVLKGKSVTEAHALAVRTSAYVCTQKGAMPVLPAEITG